MRTVTTADRARRDVGEGARQPGLLYLANTAEIHTEDICCGEKGKDRKKGYLSEETGNKTVEKLGRHERHLGAPRKVT